MSRQTIRAGPDQFMVDSDRDLPAPVIRRMPARPYREQPRSRLQREPVPSRPAGVRSRIEGRANESEEPSAKAFTSATWMRRDFRVSENLTGENEVFRPAASQ
jgi:hypothetical protein